MGLDLGWVGRKAVVGVIQRARPIFEMCAVKPTINPLAVGLVRDRRRVAQARQVAYISCDASQDVVERHLAPSHRSQVVPMFIEHREIHPASGEQFDALNSQANRMGGVLGVEAVDRHQFWAIGVRTRLAGHGTALGVQVAEEPVGRQFRDEPMRVVDQF
jgi:hypothetical protein